MFGDTQRRFYDYIFDKFVVGSWAKFKDILEILIHNLLLNMPKIFINDWSKL